MISKITFEDDLHNAMRQKNEIAKNTIKILISSIKMAEIEKGSSLDEATILSIIQREIKMRRESIAEFTKGNRPDLIQTAEIEIQILQKYLPAQLSDEEITIAAIETIKEINAASPSDIGKVMKILIPKLSGKAPADRISAIVRSLLS